MIRFIMFGQCLFFFTIGIILTHNQVEKARLEATVAVYVEMPVRALGEINI